MEKNTSLVLLPQKGNALNSRERPQALKEEPSQRVIDAILSYSKALKVEKCSICNDFIAYIIN